MAGSIETDDIIGDLLTKIQEFVFPRRIRCKEFFADSDPLKCGRVSYVVFHKALDRMGITFLTESDVTILAEHFTQYGPKVEKPAIFDYKAFCAVVDEVFVTEPGPQVSSSPGSTQMMTFQRMRLSDEKEEKVYHVLHRFATLCKARGIIVKNIFVDLDRTCAASPSMLNNRRGGKVTKTQFIRLFPFKKEMTEEDIELLAEAYLTEGGDVHFQALHNDVSEASQTGAQPFPESPLYLKPDHTEWSHSLMSAVEMVRAKVVEKRCRILEGFHSFDNLRKGFCTVGQLKAVLTMMNLAKDIDGQKFDEIVAGYLREDGLFCYKDFCDDVNSAFTTPNLEQSPLMTIPMPDASNTAPARRNAMTMDGQTRQKVIAVEDMIRKKVSSERVLLKDKFKAFDPPHRGFITRNQFVRVMNGIGFNLNEDQVSLLCTVYCNVGNHTDFDYNAFNSSVDPPDDDEALAMEQSNAPYQEKLPQPYFDAKGQVIPAGSK